MELDGLSSNVSALGEASKAAIDFFAAHAPLVLRWRSAQTRVR
jgi:hypothetical protein